jgi:hypothetical protein
MNTPHYAPALLEEKDMESIQFEAMLSVLNRIAIALEASKPAEIETITLPIGAYKDFDWSQINCRVFAEDEFGVAQVFCLNDGRVYTRRTNDKFGSEIWYSRGDGKTADGTPRYKRLIEFREIKDAEPMGRKAEQALKHAPAVQSPALNPPVATLGERISAQQPPAAQQVIEQKPTLPPPPERQELPAALRKDWLHWHDQAAKFGTVPAELGLYDTDTIASVNEKIGQLIKLVEIGAEDAALQLYDKLVIALADAKEAGVDVPAEFYETAGVAISVIEMRIGTIGNLIAAKQGAQVMTQQQPQTQIAGVTGQQVINALQDAAAKSASRVMSNSMSFDTVSALEYIAGNEAMRHAFCGRVFGQPKFGELKDAQKYALFSWLKPARVNGKAQPTNQKAASEFAAVMAIHEVPA